MALIALVVLTLILAPTIAFGLQEGAFAIFCYWVSFLLLAGMGLYGAYLVLTDRAVSMRHSLRNKSGLTPYQRGVRSKHRAHIGFTLVAWVVLVFIFAPTIVFWVRYGFTAMLAHWASVALLGALTATGLYLVLTDKVRARKKQ